MADRRHLDLDDDAAGLVMFEREDSDPLAPDSNFNPPPSGTGPSLVDDAEAIWHEIAVSLEAWKAK